MYEMYVNGKNEKYKVDNIWKVRSMQRYSGYTVFAKKSEVGHLSEISLLSAESTWEPAFVV